MSFQFRYQRILDVRELEEEREQAELAEIQNRLREEREKLNELCERQETIFERARRKRSGKTSVQAITLHQQHARRIKARIEEQEQTVREWEDKLEEQRQELIEASQRKQVLETLKERDFEEFQEEFHRQQSRLQDEVANQQYHREEET